jgi:hypothetical protein
MPEIYILKFIKDWGTYKAGQIIIKESRLTRGMLVDLYKVAVEWIGDEKPQDPVKHPPATPPLRGIGQKGQPTPKKSPNSAKPGMDGGPTPHEIVRPSSRRRGR